MMYPKPKPINKEGSRNLGCVHYGVCLDHAVEKHWRHWNCNQCWYKSKKQALDAVRTVQDTTLCYEIPSVLVRRFQQRRNG
jgi:hypothetical protein